MKRNTLGLVLAALVLLGACAGPKRMPPVGDQGDAPLPTGPEVPVLLGVGLVEGSVVLELRASGPALLLEGRQRRLLARVATGVTVTCRRRGDELVWEVADASGQAGSVILQPDDPDDRVLHDTSSYRGEFLVITTPDGTGLTLVNNVQLEGYLRGVVPYEIGRHGQDELAAVEAQAVAARTYTVSHLGARRSHGFDVFASVMDQVYRGSAQEDSLCNEAVERTAGLVLRHDGREITAYYSACCGGETSNIQEVWSRGAEPYLVSHRDGPRDGLPYCGNYKHFRWTETWTRARLERVMTITLPAYLEHMAREDRAAWAGDLFTRGDGHGDSSVPGGLRDLEIRRRTTSGRVALLDVTTEAGTYHLRGDRVRWVFPPPGGHPAILRSAFFDLEVERRDGVILSVRATGRGYGHGIGMCQTGALEMARRGIDMTRILEHYYPGTVLARFAGPAAP